MTSTSHKVSLIFPILVTILTWSLLGGYYIIFARTWIWLLVGCLLVMAIIPRYYIQKGIGWMVLYIIIVLSNYYMGDSYYNTINKALSEFSVLILSTAIGYYCSQPENEHTSTLLMIILIIIISFTSVATIIIDLSDAGIVRRISGSIFQEENDYEVVNAYFRMGGTNYYLPHALPVIIPPIVLGIKNKNISFIYRIMLILFLVVVLLLVYVSDVASAILISMVILMLSMLTKSGNIKRNIYMLIVSALVVLILLTNQSLFVKLIDYIDGLSPEGGAFSVRLRDIKESLLYNEVTGDLEARINLYEQSTQEFFSSILVGSNEKMGGHSAIMDRISTLGIIGFIPYVLFIAQNLKVAYRKISSKYRIYYIEGLIAAIMMLLFKNMSNWEMWLMLFVTMPIMIERLGGEGDRNNQSKEVGQG